MAEKAVDFILGGDTKCDGFTKESYMKVLKQFLKELKVNADKELKNDIEHILQYRLNDRLVSSN